jgi:hypothetical protein
MITRAPRPTSNFYMLDKAISEDKRLSWAARGVLIFLLGKPDHWQVSPAALTKETEGLKRGTGRDGVYAILKELQEVGYLQVSGMRDASGSFASTDYVVSETPCVVSHPHPAQPDTGQPDTGQPYPANPPQVSIDSKQGLNKKQGLNILPATPTGSPADDAAPIVATVPEKPEAPKPISSYRLKLAEDKAAREAEKASKAEEAAAAKEAQKLAQAGLRLETWAAFDEAYQARYGAKVIRNATTNSLMASLVGRLGDAAPGVAAFYLNVTDPYIVRNTHSLNLLLQGAESYHMQWQTNRLVAPPVTAYQARQDKESAWMAAMTSPANTLPGAPNDHAYPDFFDSADTIDAESRFLD